jgi:Mn2+/Fe2+ NRAMP family transporter
MKTAVAVFGITGVGAAELFMYPYWCIEKGYAQSTGENDFTPAWRDRALGWVRVMHLDIIASMIIYTFATAAFYLLGAGVLHPQGLIPKSKEMIATLSHMYTDTLGPWALWVFYVGAIATLYGTIFAATASNSRVFADVTTLLGVFKADDYAQRIKWRNRFVVVLLTIPTALHFLRIDPTQMVKMGGIAQAAMLPIIAVTVLTLRQRSLPKEMKSTGSTAAMLWTASVVTIVMMLFYVVKLVTG